MSQIYLIPSTIAAESHRVISPQVREVISMVDHYVAENIRTARRFISSLQLKDVSTLNFEVFDKHTDIGLIPELMAPLMDHKPVGVISEAGCPAIADPGNLIVQWAHKNGVQVVPLSGPSSIILALMGSGLNGQHFEFHGYLPIEKHDRIKKIRQLESESSRSGKTQIFMETPYRNRDLAGQLVEVCKDETLVCFATEITSESESILTKTAVEWHGNLPDLHKKPTIFLIQARSSRF